jgi:integrase
MCRPHGASIFVIYITSGLDSRTPADASTALAEGIPISEVSRWLGHESITTTVDLYGHLVPEASGRP